MVTHGRVELLAHPLSQKYLQMKWNSYGKYFHVANVLFYSIFLGFITCFSSQLMESNGNTPHINETHVTHEVALNRQNLTYSDVSIFLSVIQDANQVYCQWRIALARKGTSQ